MLLETILSKFKDRVEASIVEYGKLGIEPPVYLLQTYSYLMNLTRQDSQTATGVTASLTEINTLSVAITSNSTNYERGALIDLRGFNYFSVVPIVAAPGGSTGYYKIQWSLDAANWFDETLDGGGAIANGEQFVVQNTMVRSFPSDTVGVKLLSAATFSKRARYIAVAQKSDSSVSCTCEYSYQKF